MGDRNPGCELGENETGISRYFLSYLNFVHF